VPLPPPPSAPHEGALDSLEDEFDEPVLTLGLDELDELDEVEESNITARKS
jgi:hypothetical protein